MLIYAINAFIILIAFAKQKQILLEEVHHYEQ